jgi:anti-sigma factor RsiW
MMCPDRQILSVYLDGELPSPWKEKMEIHLSKCPQCREQLETYRLISRRLEADAGSVAVISAGAGTAASETDAVSAARERVWLNIAASAGAGRRIIHFPGTGVSAFWRRKISLPLPAAAALAAAVAAFVVVFASTWLRQPAVIPQPHNTAAKYVLSDSATGFDLQGTIPVSDMNGVLQYLGDTDAGDFVILRLPESRNFKSSGEPTILKAADYRPSNSLSDRTVPASSGRRTLR